jgi:hypothetical protein
VHLLSTTSSKGAKTKEFSGTPIKNKTNLCSLADVNQKKKTQHQGRGVGKEKNHHECEGITIVLGYNIINLIS